MISAGTTHWLRWHAGLESDLDGVHSTSVAEGLDRPDPSGERLENAIADLLDAMAVLNTELNGAVPSKSFEREDKISLAIVFAVAEIVNLLRQRASRHGATETAQNAASAAWRVEAAWLAVLHGDIDDLGVHLAEEEAMRNS